MNAAPRVFISYSHDSKEHERAVLALAYRLRNDEVDVWLDQYEVAPLQGWPRWMEQEIEKAEFVLMVCTETYLERVRMRASVGTGLGALWEGNLIYQHLYEAGTINSKFIPILPTHGSVKHIPMPVRGAQRYSPFSENGYQALYRRLTNQPFVHVPPLGQRRTLEPVPIEMLTTTGDNQAATISCTSPSQLAILLPQERTSAFVPVIESQWNEREATLLLEPEMDAYEAKTFLDALRGQRQKVYVGYKNNAAVAYVRQIQHATSKGQDRWQIVFQLEKTDFSHSMEMSTTGLTANQAAVKRAKRILLNENPSQTENSDVNDTLWEILISGQGAVMSVKESPFPAFFQNSTSRTAKNLGAAWALAVVQLKLSATVEHVTRLELTLRKELIDVVFSGCRKKLYCNQPAFQIEFSGSCPI